MDCNVWGTSKTWKLRERQDAEDARQTSTVEKQNGRGAWAGRLGMNPGRFQADWEGQGTCVVGARTQRKKSGSGRYRHSDGTQKAGIGDQYPILLQDKARSSQALCD